MIGQDSNSTTLTDKPVSRTGRLVCRRQRRRLLALLVVSVVAGMVWFFWPARPNLTGFDPAAMAQLETAMWRDYYGQRWLPLLGHTWRASRQQYGFSRWDSLRLAWHAARAARAFQRDTDDPAAISAMTTYYQVVAKAAPGVFDARKAAGWEMHWWRQRRKSAPSGEWSQTIATWTASLYGCSVEQMLPAAQARTQAMIYRDARRKTGLNDAEWREVSRQLFTAYDQLRQAVKNPQRPGASHPAVHLDYRLAPDKQSIPDSSPNCQHFHIGVECCEPPPSAPIFWHHYRNGQVTYFNASQLC